jgi:N-dimethylarginine dimethylaminohydrolase
MKLNINNETSKLESVVVGLATEGVFGLNPKERWCLKNGITPNFEILKKETELFVNILEKRGVEVYRPNEIVGEDVIQLYTRDIGFVIDSKYVVANMRLDDRQKEVKSLNYLTSLIGEENILRPPKGAIIEGGDIVLHDNYVFVGQSYRTNSQGYEFIKKSFPNKEVIPIKLDYCEDAMSNVLHLDCAFQPIGADSAIIYDNGIKGNLDALYDIFFESSLIHISAKERMSAFPNNLFTNIFSIDQNTVISEKNYRHLNENLNKKGIEVIALDYFDSAIQDGLFRCSTLPLYREE